MKRSKATHGLSGVDLRPGGVNSSRFWVGRCCSGLQFWILNERYLVLETGKFSIPRSTAHYTVLGTVLNIRKVRPVLDRE